MSIVKQVFIEAIHKKILVKIRFSSENQGIIERICVPFDYGPIKNAKDNLPRYQTFDLNSPNGPHSLNILPKKIIKIEQTLQTFNPGDYVTWSPNWCIPRNWGQYS